MVPKLISPFTSVVALAGANTPVMELVVKLTGVVGTLLPVLSVTMTLSDVLPVIAVTLGVSKVTATFAGRPGTNEIEVEPDDPPELAITVVLPTRVGAVKVVVAIPRLFVIPVGESSAPLMLLKVTVALGITAPAPAAPVVTRALITVELRPSAVILAAPDVTVTLPTTGATAPPTAYPVEALSPVAPVTVEGADCTMAETEAIPACAPFAADRITEAGMLATPFASVRAPVGFSCPNIGFVLNSIPALGMPTPAAFFKVAVTVAEMPVEIELVERAMVKVGAATGAVEPGVVPAGVPSPQPASTATSVANNNDTEKFEIFW